MSKEEASHCCLTFSLLRRFWVCALLTTPLFLSHMAAWLPFFNHHGFSGYLEALLATPVVVWGAAPFFKRGWQSFVSCRLNMFSLISLGIAIAYLYSLIALFLPQLLPQQMLNDHNHAPLYFEAAAMITTLVLLGQLLENSAYQKTNRALQMLLDLTPKKARLVLKEGKEEEIALAEVKVGDLLRVLPGQKVPVDGTVFEGTSHVDESMITGEAMPIAKSKGDQVIAGTMNGKGSFLLTADKVGDKTLLAQIVDMAQQAQHSKVPIQQLVDQVSAYFVPVVISIALLTFILWYFIGPAPQLGYAIVNAIAVLIIACPCALGLATPVSIIVGTGRGAQAGVLIKNGQALQQMEQIDTLVIDKTGTLTEGKPKIAAVYAKVLEEANEDKLLFFAASLELGSEHPLAECLVKMAREKKIELKNPSAFFSEAGLGVKGQVDEQEVVIGSNLWLNSCGVDKGWSLELKEAAEKYQSEGCSLLFIALNGSVAGLFAVKDPIKESSFEAIKDLHKAGLKIVMATGDNAKAAEAIAKKLQIDTFKAQMTPKEKGELIRQLKAQKAKVAMAGDGINDALALAEADVGIAMSSGSDIAIESGSITLIKGDLRGVMRAHKLSYATMRNIRQNLFFAFIYNGISVPLAAGILYPFTGLLLSPAIAALAMSLSSVSVISNALRLRFLKL